MKYGLLDEVFCPASVVFDGEPPRMSFTYMTSNLHSSWQIEFCPSTDVSIALPHTSLLDAIDVDREKDSHAHTPEDEERVWHICTSIKSATCVLRRVYDEKHKSDSPRYFVLLTLLFHYFRPICGLLWEKAAPK